MPFETSWYVEKRVIRSYLYGDVTEDEFVRSSEAMEAFIQAGSAPLYLLIDVRKASKFPMSFKHIAKGMSRYKGNEKVKWTIVLTGSGVLNVFSLLVSRVLHLPIQIFKTQQEANQFIVHYEPELASLLRPNEAD